MQTPHGVFELKYFFDNKLITDEGEDVSVRSVKEKISQLVTDEDKARPLSDQQIVEELSKGGLENCATDHSQIPRSAKNSFAALPERAVKGQTRNSRHPYFLFNYNPRSTEQSSQVRFCP